MRVGLGLKSEKEGVQCGSYRGECGVSTGPAYKNHRLWKCREMREVTCCPRFRSPACCLFLPEWCGVVPLTPHPTTVCNRLLSVTSPILTSHSILNNCTILSRNLRKKIIIIINITFLTFTVVVHASKPRTLFHLISLHFISDFLSLSFSPNIYIYIYIWVTHFLSWTWFIHLLRWY